MVVGDVLCCVGYVPYFCLCVIRFVFLFAIYFLFSFLIFRKFFLFISVKISEPEIDKGQTKTKTEPILNMSDNTPQSAENTSIGYFFKVNNLPINYPTDCGQYIQMYYRFINNNPTKFTSDTEFVNCNIFGLPSER